MVMTKKQRDFLFLLEHEDREGASIRRIVKKLENEGKKVSILSLEFHLFLISKIDPSVVVIPYGFDLNQWPINYIVREFPNAQFFSLNWEQLLTPINQYYKKPRDAFFRERVKHIAWNEDFKSFLVENGVLEKNIAITGNVHYELLAEDAKNKNHVKVELAERFKLDAKKTWVFLPMNYAWAFISDTEIRGKINKGYDSKNAWIYKDYASKCLALFLDFLTLLSSKHVDYQFIVRPHPSISCGQYYRKAAEKGIEFGKNIVFSKELTIREWIVASEIVGSSWSSSVWDAVNSGKKGFLFTPLDKPEWHTVWWEKYLTNYQNFEEVDFYALSDGIDCLDHSRSLSASDNIVAYLNHSLRFHKSVSLKEQVRFDPKILFLCKVKKLRTFLRYSSVKWFGAIGIRKGFLRDFFEPKL